MFPRLSRPSGAALALLATLTACSAAPRPTPPPAAIGPVELVEADGEAPLWGSDLVARVSTPAGNLGPRTSVGVDPRTVDGISWTGRAWEMDRDWDEDADGGYLDFGAAALDVNGHRVLGFRIEVPAGIEAGHVIEGGGELGYFEITNPAQNPHNSYIRDVDVAHHYVALGVAGDAIKVGEGASSHHDAFIEMEVGPGRSGDKHYDGVQVFGSGSLELERIVIDWNDVGTIANTTAAVFTQDDASLTARDIIVLDPGGTWQIIRLSGGGPHDVDDVQVSGSRGANRNQPESEAPISLVKITNGSATFTLHNEVPGTSDWLISESS